MGRLGPLCHLENAYSAQWPIGLVETNRTISTSYQFAGSLTFTGNALFSPDENVFFVLSVMDCSKY